MKGGEKGKRKKMEDEGRGGEEEERRKFSVLHMNELLTRSQYCERTGQTLKEFGMVLRWWGVARGSVVRLLQQIEHIVIELPAKLLDYFLRR